MNVGSLFSGIGGLDLGLARAGFRHAFFCEQDAWRREVLAHHWPGVQIYEDVGLVGRDDGQTSARGDGNASYRYDGRSSDTALGLLCGGFPCQDVSVAGRRAGLAGARSGLFHEFARIAESLRPRWLLVENVPGLLSSNGGRDFGVVLGTLADIGYGVAWRIVDSRYFGVPQRRRRVFILGAFAESDTRAAAERAGEILAVGTRCPGHPATGAEARTAVTPALSGRSASRLDDQGSGQLVTAFDWQAGDGGSDESFRGKSRSYIVRKGEYAMLSTTKVDAIYGLNTNRGGNADMVLTEDASPPITGPPITGSHGNPGGVMLGQAVRRLTPTECERLQALPDGWTDFGPDSRRYAALGDAVTASVSEWIGRRLIASGL